MTQLNIRVDNNGGPGTIWFDDIRLHPSAAQMTTYTYNPFVGITSQSDVNSRPTSYDYDGLNRLLNVKDDDGNIVKNYRYNYGLGTVLTPSATSLYYNATAQGTYTRNNCTGGSTGTSVVYTVPAGKYSATTQAAADAMATADVSNNGQAYANANGQCLFYSALASGFAFKNDCAPTQGSGSRVTYSVPAGTYTSTVDQPTANALATTDVANNKQAYANAHGTCSCAAEGQRFINGVCTTGTRYNSSTSQLPNGQWQCIYYYTFSDGYTSQNYTSVGSSPCSIQ